MARDPSWTSTSAPEPAAPVMAGGGAYDCWPKPGWGGGTYPWPGGGAYAWDGGGAYACAGGGAYACAGGGAYACWGGRAARGTACGPGVAWACASRNVTMTR